MTFKRVLSLTLSFVLTVCLLTGCGKSEKPKYNKKAEILSVKSGVVAKNDKLELSYDDALKCVLLKNKKTDKVWSNIPYEEYLNGNAYSTLNIVVQDMQNYQREQFSSEELAKNGRISCEKIDNGIRLTYYFDSVKISVPVDYVLRSDSLLMSIDASKIIEGDNNYRIYYASASQKFCSVLQSEKDAYIFAPYGSGAIINTGSLPDGKRRMESSGPNEASLSTTNPVDPEESGGLQVFGIKDKKDALLCIPEDCAGATGIHFLAGDRQSDYSSIYPVFYFVDFDDVNGRAANSGEVRQLSERTQSVISAGFYPLSGKKANYNGMAEKYREYLIRSGYINEKENGKDFSSPYAVTLLGGVMTTSSILGIPVSTLKTMTDFKSAKKIVSELSGSTGIKPVVRLQGFGESGINIGEIAGGYSFGSEFGGNDDRMELENYCKKNNIPLYTQFETVKYSESGSGFSYTFDAAKTATLHSAEQKATNIPLRDFNANITYRLLSRSKLSNAIDKLVSAIKKKSISGVSLSTLGRISYSDYGDGVKYSVTSLMESDTKEYIERIAKTGCGVAGSEATYFAAGLMDAVFESPLDSSGKYQIEKDVPFYQIVFSGVTPLYSSSINLDSNPERKIMLAAATGTGLGFSIIDNFDKTYMENNVYPLYACVYDKNKDYISDVVKEYSAVYSAVAGVRIKSYDIINEKISKTTFENGKVVYANHSSGKADSPVGVLEGYGFKLGVKDDET
ncbi:MAG: hypothetical protein J5852_02630 [Clostridia bacterium]|nr:hypothetical protein [Clostridia bacterium]